MNYLMKFWQSEFQAIKADSTPDSFSAIVTKQSKPLWRTVVATSAIIASLIFSNMAQAELKPIDNIVAVVNQDIIMMSELSSRVLEIKTRYANNASILPEDSILNGQVLDQLIIESIQIQQAKSAGMIAPIEDINSSLENFANGSGTNINQLIAAQPELYQEIRQQIEKQILISLIQRQEVSRRIQVNPREVDIFLNTTMGRSANNKEYRFQYLRVDSKTEADEIYEALLQGKKLADELDSRDLGFKAESKLPSILSSLSLAEIEQAPSISPIEMNGQFHLFQLNEVRTANTRKVNQVLARHILIKPNVLLTSEKAKALAIDLSNQLKNGADFASLAREYSDDVSSRVQGGELGWQDPKTFVPEFTQALQKLKKDEISPITKTDFGWHIIQMLDTREQDIGEQELRNQTTQAIFQNRYQQELPRWILEQKETAFVEIRL